MTHNQPISIHFNKFWGGFLEGTNPNSVIFFIELFKKVFNTDVIVERDYIKADILCEHMCHPEDSLIYKKQWKYSFLATGECVAVAQCTKFHFNDFSCILSGLKPDRDLKRLKFPLFTSYLFCNSEKSLEPIKIVPKKMVCAIIGNPNAIVRSKFLDALEKKTAISYGGPYRNNIGFCIGGDHNSNELINFIKEHKFMISMENNKEDYYITEKICNGLFAGVIPIYWGSPNITEYFNEDRILHLKDDSDNEINKIIDEMLNMSDDVYLEKVNSQIFKNGNNDTFIESITNDIKDLINT